MSNSNLLETHSLHFLSESENKQTVHEIYTQLYASEVEMKL